MEYSKLFESITIKTMELKNRIVMPAMCTKFPNEIGACTPQFINWYVERAKNDVGLIIIENTCVDWPQGKAAQNPIRLDDDKFIMGLKELADAVHPYGAKLATNLQHTGRQTSVLNSTEGVPLISSSDVPCKETGGDPPRPLTLQEIDGKIDKWAQAIRRTKAAGFDAAEIHGAHGYLITQFMSPYTNMRTDAYGGSFEKRMRFPVEIIQRARELVGDNFPLIFRFSADEFIPHLGGYTIKEGIEMAKTLERAGVDMLNISGGIYESWPYVFPMYDHPEGIYVENAAKIKKEVNIPVCVVGKLGLNPELSNRIIAEGKADLVAWGRTLIADPELVKKVYEGRLEDIRPCIYCNEGCVGTLFRALKLSCSVNPLVGKEGTIKVKKTDKPKNIIVVGGGPAGMEAALTLAKMGHTVSLYEKEAKLGGLLHYASAESFKKDIEPLIQFYQTQLKKNKVRIILNRKITFDTIEKTKADELIIATGSMPLVPDIPGIDRNNVFYAEDVIVGKKETRKRVVIIGAGQVGCETAWDLAEKGKNVTLVEMLPTIAADANTICQHFLNSKMAELGVRIMTNTIVVAVKAEGVVVENKNFTRMTLPTDTVIIAAGRRPDKELFDKLRAKNKRNIHYVGDCVKTGKIMEAVHSGFNVALNIHD